MPRSLENQSEQEMRVFQTVTTGGIMSSDKTDNVVKNFLGTYLLNDGSFVGHVFETREIRNILGFD